MSLIPQSHNGHYALAPWAKLSLLANALPPTSSLRTVHRQISGAMATTVGSEKAALVKQLLGAKAKCNKTFSQIATQTGLTNVYVAQLFHRQAPLPPSLESSLASAVPTLTSDLLNEMKTIPSRCYDPQILQDPCIYRLHEATTLYAESIKSIINEELGDGIMSAIGFYCSVEKIKGKDGEDRVAVVFNGKFLPHTVQKAEDNVARLEKSEE